MENPLNPTSVPLEAETVLWFEFLLNPNLLTEHLGKKSASPAPIDLISTFLAMTPESNPNSGTSSAIATPDIEPPTDKTDELKWGRKQMALKILELKVAAYLKWDLQAIERSLPLRRQVQFLSDLCSITSGKFVSMPITSIHDIQIGPLGSKKALNFALTIYHRWVLRTQMSKGMPAKIPKQCFNYLLLANQDQANAFRDELFLASLEPLIKNSLEFLHQIPYSEEPFFQLTYDSFIVLDPNNASERNEQDFDNSTAISRAELRAQIAYELCDFYLYDKRYELAKQKASECRDNYRIMRREYAENAANRDAETDFLFCTFTEDELNGRLMACGLFDIADTSLIYRMHESIINKYDGIQQIFAEDNEKIEIPLLNRRNVALDMESVCDQQRLPKEKLIRVDALNTVRSCIDGDDLFLSGDFLMKHRRNNGVQCLLEETVSHTRKSKKPESKTLLKPLCYETILTSDMEELGENDFAAIRASGILDQPELDVIKRKKQLYRSNDPTEDRSFSPLCTIADWKLSDDKVTALELGALKRQLINCSKGNAVRILLVKCTNLIIASDPPITMEPWHINPNWILPPQMDAVLRALPRGFLQDYTYVMVAKARDFIGKHAFKSATNLMIDAKNEVQRHDATTNTLRLSKVIENEILFAQTTQQLYEWPKRHTDIDIVIPKCKQALKGNGDVVAPRSEIVCSCAAVLLNYNETADLLRSDRRYPLCEPFAAIASIIEAEKHKPITVKKVYRDAWDVFAQLFVGLGSTQPIGSVIKKGHGPSQHDAGNYDKSEAGESSEKNDSAMDDVTASTSDNSSASHLESMVNQRFNDNNQRDNSIHRHGDNNYGPHGSSVMIVNTNLLPFIQKLRDPMALTIILSMLVRLHNILDDNSNREMNIEFLNNWPASIPNSNSYSIETVIEILNVTLRQALQYYPQHVPFIRLEADLEFRNENYEAALASYVNAIMSGSQYCTINLDQFIDDYIVRRMMKCSTSLGCYMQAAIFCQFLAETDYGLAFKTFSDRTTFKTITDKSIVYIDAVDSYYHCIWDVTLLEFIINFLSKRGEHARKQLAVAALGQPELNTNNSDEIRREVATSRKINFLRSLSRQYSL